MKTILLPKQKINRSFILIALVLLASLQVYANRNIKFSVDMSLMVSQGKFNPNTDMVYIRGNFNNWTATNPMSKGTGNVFSVTLSLADNSYQEYKYFINTPGAANGGWEDNFPVAASGNRPIGIGSNDLTLPAVFYNDGNMDQRKTTAHFNFYYTSQENPIIEDYSTKLENSFQRITTALQTTVNEKTDIYIYNTLAVFHLSIGYPEMPEWGTGTAWGKKLITVVSPTQVGYNGAVDVLIHEFTHNVEAWKTQVSLPAWLNEGVACYYGRNAPESYEGQTSFRNYIKTLINQSGKPFIEWVFSGNEGYTWSTAMAYYIAMTKGEPALAKFVQNMNYSDLGFANLTALQTAWWSFLDDFTNTQNKSNVKFTVDMADMIKYGYFVPGTNRVFVRGGFNNWGSTPLTLESGTLYSVTVPMSQYYFVEYKFYTDNATAPNAGWESEINTNFGYSGNRMFTMANSNITLPVASFSFPVPQINLNSLVLKSPTLPGILIAGDTATIAWQLTNIANINIEFSDDNGARWQTVKNNLSTAPLSTKWVVNNSISANCKIRISDASNATIHDESQSTFRIVQPNNMGGPYLFDKNTVALLHFDNDLSNRSNQSGNALGQTGNIGTTTNLPADLGNCISTASPIMIPHSAALNLTGDWTIEAWVKFTSFGNSHMYLFTKPGDLDAYESNYSLEVNPWWGNVFYGFYFKAANSRIGQTSVSPQLNEWYQVAFIRDTKQSAISVIVHDKNRNLVAANSAPYTGTEVYLNTQNLQIGNGINGYIDEVRISKVARSFINTSLQQPSQADEFAVYPNPTDGIIHITGANAHADVKVNVVDITGKTVLNTSCTGFNPKSLNLGGLKKGVYFVQLIGDQSFATRKIILQ